MKMRESSQLVSTLSQGAKKSKICMKRDLKRVHKDFSNKEKIAQDKVDSTKRKATRLDEQELKRLRLNKGDDEVGVGPVAVEVEGVELEELVEGEEDVEVRE